MSSQDRKPRPEDSPDGTAGSGAPAENESPAPRGDTPSRRRLGLLVAAASLALLLDVLTKVLAVAHLEGQPPVRLAGGALYLVLVRNPGAAFSMATGMTWVLTLIALGVVVWILWIATRLRSTGWALGLGLILGGALGNLVDRFVRSPGPLRGHVVDFLSVFAPDGSVFPVFNIADSAITVGCATIVLMTLLGRDYDGGVVRDRKRTEETGQEATR
ncbi:MAG TPA: signal peptidase II [Pseudonocardiaceae bacterium]